MIDIKQALKKAIMLLSSTSPSAQIDAEILLSYVLGTSRTYLYTHPEMKLSSTQQKTYQQCIDKRCQGVPVAYITGSREFWSLPLQISEDTLIPRPETELLVELALTLSDSPSSLTVLDLGTGCGAIALALASERPKWSIIGCDLNEASVKIAKHNADLLRLSNIQFIHSNWFSAFPFQQFDIIVSNPPYIAANDPHLLQGDVRFEPSRALISGKEGLDDLSFLIKHSYDHLRPGGLLLLEHGFNQKDSVTSMLHQAGYERIQCWQDIFLQDRVSGGWRK